MQHSIATKINYSRLPGLPLAGMAWPERREPTPAQVQELLIAEGVSTVVNLTGHSYGDPSWAKQFSVLDFPVVDFGVPRVEQVDAAWQLFQDLSDGDVVLFHCAVGVGRTGTFLACLLGRMKSWPIEQTLSWLRKHRPGSVETKVQEKFIHDWLVSRK